MIRKAKVLPPKKPGIIRHAKAPQTAPNASNIVRKPKVAPMVLNASTAPLSGMVRKPKVIHLVLANKPHHGEAQREYDGFKQRCRQLKGERGFKDYHEYLIRKMHTYTGRLPKLSTDNPLKVMLTELKVAYWLERCAREEKDQEITDNFWKDYDAALSGNLRAFSPLMRDIIVCLTSYSDVSTTRKEESTMTVVKKAVPAAPVATTPKKIVKKIITKHVTTAPAAAKKVAPKPVVKVAPKKVIAAPAKAKKDVAASSSSRVLVFDKHSATSVLRWIGSKGYNAATAFAAMEKLGIPTSMNTVNSQVAAGHQQTRGEPAVLNRNEEAELKRILASVEVVSTRAPKAAAAKKTAKKVAPPVKKVLKKK